MPVEDSSVEVDGLSFHCRVEGAADGPWMIFANSLATTMSVWDEQVEAFGKHYRILRYDQRGHGLTPVPSSPCSFDRLAEDAAALLQHFGVENGVFVGVSMGAVTALRLAQKHPQRLRAVVACDGQPASPAGSVELWEKRIAIAREQGMAALVEPTIDRWFKEPFKSSGGTRLDEVRAMIRNTPTEGYVANVRALQDYDFRDGFRAAKLPILLLVGAEDGLLPAAMKAMHEMIGGSRFVEVAGAGHLPNIEFADQVTCAIETFLNDMTQAGE